MTEEEIARLRGYLTKQSMQRAPVQLMETLQEAYQQFETAVAALPDTASHPSTSGHTWTVLEILEHVCLFLGSYQTSICTVLEQGQRPGDVGDRQDILPLGNALRVELLRTCEETLKQLTVRVQGADPHGRLDLTWNHFELGAMHWREWLLFTRVHLLDHIQQVNQIKASAKKIS